MSLSHKISSTVEIEASAESFYNLFRKKMHKLTAVSPDNVQNVKVIHGDFETVGSVTKWYYTIANTPLTVTAKMEKADDEKMQVTFNVLDGDLLKLYKTFKVTLDVNKVERGPSVTWTIDFRKLNSVQVPSPDAYLTLAAIITKDIDAHLLAA